MNIRQLREKLEDEVCETHDKSPTIVFTGEQFIIEQCCCDKFEIKLLGFISQYSANEFSNDENDDLNFFVEDYE